jgi:hypothetical protein
MNPITKTYRAFWTNDDDDCTLRLPGFDQVADVEDKLDGKLVGLVLAHFSKYPGARVGQKLVPASAYIEILSGLFSDGTGDYAECGEETDLSADELMRRCEQYLVGEDGFFAGKQVVHEPDGAVVFVDEESSVELDDVEHKT